MKATFRRLGDGREVDLIPYVREQLSQRDDIRIYVGTDSQTIGDKTVYATVIVLHYGNTGAHVLYHKFAYPRIKDNWTRLWNEVEYSLDAAEEMYKAGLPKADFIDLDYNPDPVYHSNTVLRSALGYVESMGYKARTKPDAAAASCVADAICH
jgi:predicted RNase H-related nuclease YkuK (DUF458 family)